MEKEVQFFTDTRAAIQTDIVGNWTSSRLRRTCATHQHYIQADSAGPGNPDSLSPHRTYHRTGTTTRLPES